MARIEYGVALNYYIIYQFYFKIPVSSELPVTLFTDRDVGYISDIVIRVAAAKDNFTAVIRVIHVPMVLSLV